MIVSCVTFEVKAKRLWINTSTCTKMSRSCWIKYEVVQACAEKNEGTIERKSGDITRRYTLEIKWLAWGEKEEYQLEKKLNDCGRKLTYQACSLNEKKSLEQLTDCKNTMKIYRICKKKTSLKKWIIEKK